MKRIIYTLALVLAASIALAQAPQAFKYQAIARDANGQIYANQNMSYQISILQGNASGNAVYVETHNVTSNDFGLVNLNIGQGTVVSGDFTTINWGADTYFIEIGLDKDGGNNYVVVGTSQLLSVPYALHAKTVEMISETDPVYSGSVSAGITSADTAFWNADMDADTTNELIDSLVLSGTTLTAYENGSITTVDLGPASSKWNENGNGNIYRMSNVGIGTSSPGYTLHIVDSIPNAPFSVRMNITGGSNSNNIYTGQEIRMKGTAGTFRGAQFWTVANNPNGINQGLWVSADSAKDNIALYALSGTNQSQLSSGTSYGIYAKGTNSTLWNSGLYGETGETAPWNYGVMGLAATNIGNYNGGVIGYAYGAGTGTNVGLEGYAENSSTTNIGVAVNTGLLATGTATKNYGVHTVVQKADTAYGVFATAPNTGGAWNVGVYGTASGGTTNYAGYFSGDVVVTGNLSVTGSISKGSGTFKIDHPLDPANKYLVHSFVESPDMLNIYTGNVVTDAQGYATVELPGYFESANTDFRYQLTPVGQFAQVIIKEEVSGNKFVIQSDIPNVKVSWTVTAVRNDPYARANRIEPEVEKPESERGKYLHPEVYDKDSTNSIYKPLKGEDSKKLKEKRKLPEIGSSAAKPAK